MMRTRLQQPLRDARATVRASLNMAPLGECTRDTPRCADARSYQVDLRPCCRGHIRNIVAQVADIFAELKVVWWMDYGTLLGAVRNPMLGLEPGIIPHDKDADCGFLWHDWPKVMRARASLERKGFAVKVSLHGEKMKVRLSAMNYTNLDLFAWRSQGPKFFRRRYIHVDNYKGRDFTADMAFPLITLPWEGLELPAPRNPEAFCAFRYGPTWQTPIRANHDGVRR